jgi:protein-L-isoaspartate(D-aspartate) O-methyltransferase
LIESFAANPHAERMVREQLVCRGIEDEGVLQTMARIPRHLFVQRKSPAEAYGDFPLSIGFHQTISQPYMVAHMSQELELSGRERVLEIGTGSGYQTAVLAELAQEVYSIERIPQLLSRAAAVLGRLGYANVTCREGDGFDGWPEQAPFDRILVTAAAARVPDPLKQQLADNGILLMPVGDSPMYQCLIRIRRLGGRFEVREGIGCRFVPLIH